MIDMLQNAKDLIAKGKLLNDNELIQMGMELLEQYSPKTVESINEWIEGDTIPEYEVTTIKIDEVILTKRYECTNCKHVIEYDKPGRVKCPACKKHTLVLHEATEQLPKKTLIKPPSSPNDFNVQIRKPNATRVRYDDNGEPIGQYTRAEQVTSVHNEWNDDKTEGFDAANEILKQHTKISPRTRPPVKKISVVCDQCKQPQLVHPIHGGGRARFLCDRCNRKRSRS